MSSIRSFARTRAWLAFVLCAVLSLALVACGDDDEGSGGSGSDSSKSSDSGLPDLSGKTITYYGFGGANDLAMKKAWFEPFEKATGARVVLDEPVDFTKVQAQIDAGNVSYDFVDGDDATWEAKCGEDWVDLSDVDQSDVAEEARPTSKCGVPDYQYTYLIAYDKKKFPNGGPKTCADFFDTNKFPGKRGIWSYPVAGFLECAAVAGGADAKDPYPLDIDETTGKLESIKSDLATYDSTAQGIDQMQNNDVAMGIYTSRMVSEAINNGAEWDTSKDFYIRAFGSFAIPKGSKNVEATKALFNYLLKRENNERWATEFEKTGNSGYSNTTEPLKIVDPAKILPDASKALQIDWTWWGPNYSKASDKIAAATTG